MTDKLSREEKSLHWLHAWIRFYNRMFIPSLRKASKIKTRQVLIEQKEAYQYLKSLLTPIPEEMAGWLKQLIKNMKDSLKEGRRFYPTDRDIDNLKKLHDNLREGKEGK